MTETEQTARDQALGDLTEKVEGLVSEAHGCIIDALELVEAALANEPDLESLYDELTEAGETLYDLVVS